MTKADWDDGGTRLLGMFLNGEEIVTPDEHGQRIVDDSFVLLFNAGHEDAEFTLPPQRFGAQWTCELRTDGEPRRDPRRRRDRSQLQLALARAAAPHRDMTELRATYRLQLGGGFGFAQARELVPYLRDLGVSHLYLPPSFQAREGSTHGYDVVDPTSISEELGGEREFEALARAVREAGMGLILDIVPNHMATDDANRYWSDPDLRRRFFDLDEETGRHRRFFDIDHLAAVRQEDEAVFDETHKLALALVRDGTVDGLRIDHPDGLADPAGYLRRLREGGARHVWVEKILDPGEHAARLARRRHGRLRVPQRRRGAVRRPGGRGAADRAVGGGLRRPAAVPRLRRRGQARAGAHDVRARGRPAARARRRARSAGSSARSPSLPVYRTYVEPWSGRVADEDREAIAEAGLPESLARVLRLEERGWDAFVTRFQQTTPPIMAKGVEDTAFYRYARLLALNDVGGDPGRFGISIERFHAANAERAERFPNNLLVTQTHDTKRSGDVRARIGALSTMAGGVGGARAALARAHAATSPGPDDVERYLSSRRWRAPGRSSSSGCRPTWRRRCARPSARRTGSSPTRRTRPAVQAFCAALYEHDAFLADFEPFAAELAPRRRPRRARPAAAQAHRARAARRLPGRRAALALARGPRQPPAGRLGAAPARCSTSSAAAPRPTDETRKLWLIMRALVLRRTPRRPRSRAPTSRSTRARARSRSCAAATCSPRPRCAATATRSSSRAGRWRDVLAGGEHDGGDRVALARRHRAARAHVNVRHFIPPTTGSDPAAR